MGYLSDAWGVLPLFFSLTRNRASAVYDILSTHNALGEHSLYLNLGYWEGGEKTYDEACEKLAKELIRAVGLKRGEDLLDVGFGFADQDMYWAQAFAPRRIVGLNITESQVKKARERVKKRGLDKYIELLPGSATAMPVAGASFERVTALETAFHYDTREDFFREAYRVLKRGGRLATADILPLEGKSSGLKFGLGMSLARAFWQIPKANWYAAKLYREKLQYAGFINIEVRSIREKVFPPLAAFLRTRLYAEDLEKRVSPLFLAGCRHAVRQTDAWRHLDYVIAVAEKP